MKYKILVLVILFAAFGIQVTSYGNNLGDLGVVVDSNNPTTEHITKTIDTGDLKFYFRVTKDFTGTAMSATLSVSVLVDDADPGEFTATLSSTSVFLLANDTQTSALYTLTIPRSELADVGTYKFTVTATGPEPGQWCIGALCFDTPTADPGSATFTITVREPGIVEVVGEDNEYTTTEDTEDITYTLQVRNTGDAQDTIDITKAGEISDQVTLSDTSVTLAADATQNITLTIPRYALDFPGMYTITVTGTSQNDPTQTGEATTTTEVELDSADVIVFTIVGSPTTLSPITDTEDITYTLRTLNYYFNPFPMAPDPTFDISLSITGDIAAATLSRTDFTLAPNTSDSTGIVRTTEDVTLTIPRSALARPGRYQVTVTATPTNDTFSYDLNAKAAQVTVIITITDSDKPLARLAYFENLPTTNVRIRSDAENALKLAASSLEQLVDLDSDPQGFVLFKLDFGKNVVRNEDNPNDDSFPLSKLAVIDVRNTFDGASIQGHGIEVDSVERLDDTSQYQVVLSVPRSFFRRIPATIDLQVHEGAVYEMGTGIANIGTFLSLNIVREFVSEVPLLSYGVELSLKSVSSAVQTAEDGFKTYTLILTNSGTTADTINLEVLGDIDDAAISPDSTSLDPGTAQEILLTVPPGELEGELAVKATSDGDNTKTAQFTIQGSSTPTDTGTDTGTDPTTTPEIPIEPTTVSIIFSEFMFESEGGENSLPQWIEVYNNSSKETNLRGWKLQWTRVQLPPVETTTTFKEDFIIPPQQSRLIVTAVGRHAGNSNLSSQAVYALHLLHAEELAQDAIENRNRIITKDGFSLKLLTSEDVLVDHIGNLQDEEKVWELPECLVDGVRTSLIRRFDEGVPRPGIQRRGWFRAVDAKRLVAGIYYGHSHDYGTPGYRRGKSLPVQLSHFSAQFDKSQIIISWTTEAELNNAGFHVLRSTSRIKNFRRVNPKLIAGAGTTGERNTYQFIDTTAKPDVAYYYRLEDIDLSGQRETIATQQIRGVFSPTGKTITTWASLKGVQN